MKCKETSAFYSLAVDSQQSRVDDWLFMLKYKNLLRPYTHVCYRCVFLISDPYITPPGSAIYIAVISIAAGVFGVAVIVITILACMWCVKSKRRQRERFERQSSIRSSIKGSTIKSRSTMSMLSESHYKRRLDQLSLSSSKYLYDEKSLGASQVCTSYICILQELYTSMESQSIICCLLYVVCFLLKLVGFSCFHFVILQFAICCLLYVFDLCMLLFRASWYSSDFFWLSILS